MTIINELGTVNENVLKNKKFINFLFEKSNGFTGKFSLINEVKVTENIYAYASPSYTWENDYEIDSAENENVFIVYGLDENSKSFSTVVNFDILELINAMF